MGDEVNLYRTLSSWGRLGPVDDQEFRLQADKALHDLNSRLTLAANEYPLEGDMSSGALVIEFEDSPAKFVISPNAPVHQVWVSALSKSFKLEWNAGRQEFVLPSTGQSLATLISACIGEHLGDAVTL
jgi:iron donor protein CyaY